MTPERKAALIAHAVAAVVTGAFLLAAGAGLMLLFAREVSAR